MRKKIATALLAFVIFVAGYLSGYSSGAGTYHQANWLKITQSDLEWRRLNDISDIRIIDRVECLRWQKCEQTKNY